MSGQGGKEPTWGLAGVGRSWFWEAQSTRREAAAERSVSEIPQGCRGQWGGGGHCSSPEEDGQCVPLANRGRALRGWARQDSRGQAQHPLPVLLCAERLHRAEAGLGHSLCRASLIPGKGSHGVKGLDLGLPELAVLSPQSLSPAVPGLSAQACWTLGR